MTTLVCVILVEPVFNEVAHDTNSLSPASGVASTIVSGVFQRLWMASICRRGDLLLFLVEFNLDEPIGDVIIETRCTGNFCVHLGFVSKPGALSLLWVLFAML